MRRSVSLLLIGWLGMFTVAAQMPQGHPAMPQGHQGMPQRPPRPAPADVGPQGEEKLRWICAQLRLNADQKQQAESLIAVYHAELKESEENKSALLQQIQDKFAEISAARAEGNMERVKELQAEMKNMAPSASAENNFFTSLEQVLDEQQKTRLPALRRQAKTIGDVSMRPIHVLRAARKLNLTAEQMTKLEVVLAAYRQKQLDERPADKAAARLQVDQLVQDIRALLTPEQATAYDAEITTLREAAPVAAPIVIPSADPNVAPPKG